MTDAGSEDQMAQCISYTGVCQGLLAIFSRQIQEKFLSYGVTHFWWVTCIFGIEITTLAYFSYLNKLLHHQLPSITSMDIVILLPFCSIFIYIFDISHFSYEFVWQCLIYTCETLGLMEGTRQALGIIEECLISRFIDISPNPSKLQPNTYKRYNNREAQNDGNNNGATSNNINMKYKQILKKCREKC